MTRTTRCEASLLLFFILFFSFLSFSQNKVPDENTLLWRISGNGLAKPSYVFGTMHLRDKRLFQFTDSMYKALESSEGFALELNVDEMAKMVVEKSFAANSPNISGSDIDTAVVALGLNKTNLSEKDRLSIRAFRINKIKWKEEMPTFMDGFLYGVARRLGKWTGGVEDIKDQTELDFGSSSNDISASSDDLKKQMETMIRAYLKSDLDEIEMISSINPKFKNLVITNRNFKMARRIDSLSKARSTFFAIGAGHLPGDSGVLQLLANKGYKIEPVISDVRMSGEQYAAKLPLMQWNVINDEEFTVQIPGPVMESTNISLMAARMTYDITHQAFYILGSSPGIEITEKSARTLFETISKTTGSILRKKPQLVKREGKDRWHGVMENAAASYTIELFSQGGKVYMMLAGSDVRGNGNKDEYERFFNSLVLHPQNRSSEWKDTLFSEYGFHVSVPGHLKSNTGLDKTFGASMWNAANYDFVDPNNGMYYLVQALTIKDKYVVSDDTAYFHSILSTMRFQGIEPTDSAIEDLNGYSAFRFAGKKMGQSLFSKHIIRGNRLYVLVATCKNEDEEILIKRFINSFSTSSYPVSQLSVHSGYGMKLLSSEPIHPLYPGKEATNTLKANSDPNHAATFYYSKQALNRYEVYSTDSAYLQFLVKNYTEDSNLISARQINFGLFPTFELQFRKSGSRSMQRIRIIPDGDSVIFYYTIYPYAELHDEYYNKIFTNISTSGIIEPTYRNNKTSVILHDLKSSDTSVVNAAYTALGQYPFSEADLPLLHKALSDSFDAGIIDYDIHEGVTDALIRMQSQRTVDFVRDSALIRKIPWQTQLILLSGLRSENSYSLLKTKLLGKPDVAGSAFRVLNNLTDSLSLTLKLFPDLLAVKPNRDLHRIVIGTTTELLDSGLISKETIWEFRKSLLEGSSAVITDTLINELYSFVTDDIKFFNILHSHPGFATDSARASVYQLLHQLEGAEEISIRERAVEALAALGYPVDENAVRMVMADPYWRNTLFDTLQTLHLSALIPPKYATRSMIGMSDVYNQIDEDDVQSTDVKYIGERKESYHGSTMSFLLYEVILDYGDEKAVYLGISDRKAGKDGLLKMGILTGIFWDEELDLPHVSNQLKKYLASIQE